MTDTRLVVAVLGLSTRPAADDGVARRPCLPLVVTALPVAAADLEDDPSRPVAVCDVVADAVQAVMARRWTV